MSEIEYGLLYKGYENLHKILNIALGGAILEGNSSYERIKISHTFQKFDAIIEDLNDAFSSLSILKIYKTFLQLIVYYEINTYILKNIVKYCKTANANTSSNASKAYRRLFYFELLGNRDYLNFSTANSKSNSKANSRGNSKANSRGNSTETTFDIQPEIDFILHDAIYNLHIDQDKKEHYFFICKGDVELSISFLFWSYLHKSRDFSEYIDYLNGLVFDNSNRMYSQFIVEFVLNYAYDILEKEKNYFKKMSYNGMPIVAYNARNYVLGIKTDISKVVKHLPEEIKQEHNLELIPNLREEFSDDPYVYTEIQVNHIESKLHLTTTYLHDDTLPPRDTQYQNPMLSITSEYNRSSYILEISSIIKDLIYVRKEHDSDFIGGIFQIIVGIVLQDFVLGNVYKDTIKRYICILCPFIEKMQIQCGLYQQIERRYKRYGISLHEKEDRLLDSIKWNMNYIGFFLKKYKENYLFIERQQLLIYEKAIEIAVPTLQILQTKVKKNSTQILFYKLKTHSGEYLLRQVASMLGSDKFV